MKTSEEEKVAKYESILSWGSGQGRPWFILAAGLCLVGLHVIPELVIGREISILSWIFITLHLTLYLGTIKYPITLGIITVAVSLFNGLIPGIASTTLTFLGTAVMVDWVSSGRFLFGLVVIICSPISSMLTHNNLFSAVAEFFINLSLAIFAFLIWRHKLTEEMLRQQVAQAGAKAEESAHAIHQELLAQLHRGLVATLSRQVIATEIISEQIPTPRSPQLDNALKTIDEGCREGLTQLRGLMGSLNSINTQSDSSVDIAAQSLQVAVESNLQALRAKPMNIRIEVAPNLARKTSLAAMTLLVEMLNETCTNAMKYAPSESEMDITVTMDEGRLVFFSVNEIETRYRPASNLSGGYGLANLARTIKSLGGIFETSSNGKHWVQRASLSLQASHLPPRPRRPRPRPRPQEKNREQ